MLTRSVKQIKPSRCSIKSDARLRVYKNVLTRIYYVVLKLPYVVDKHYGAYLGCTQMEFTKHIESCWEPGMTWANYGKWGMHFVIPIPYCNSFEDGVIYTNLEPRWYES